MTFIYREHAIQRMFERDIYETDVEETIKNGIIIENYFDDKPYPSFLALSVGKKPLHVVFAKNDEDNEIIVITAYYPDKKKWSEDYKTRIRK
ncbi:hypothetical protein MNB_SM-3-1477 [hydrothermal vent metagenome]|uniref:DUF4258 domain-containing protein n=1 Tax=hydrothermal vent metagenome TaxID=652676 RepID=A0A1W1D293_9ZZZZ